MSDRKPTLDYATPDPKRWPTWMVYAAGFLWPLIVFDIWAVAFMSIIFTVLGIINLFHPCLGPWTDDPEMIHWTNKSWIVSNASLAAIFVPLAILHWRWKRRKRNRKT